MKKIIFILSVFIFMSSAQAEADNYQALANEKAQKIIDACWNASLEARESINTPIRDKGITDSTNCLEKHAIDLAEKYLFKKNIEYVEQFKKDLKTTKDSYRRIYWRIHQEIDHCAERVFGCGTQYSSIDISAYADLLEKLIKDQYLQIETYRLE